MLYGIQAGFGSPQVPVAELLARPAPTLLSPQKPKSSNFLQVPDMESPRYVLTLTLKTTPLRTPTYLSTASLLLVNPIRNRSLKRNLVSFEQSRNSRKIASPKSYDRTIAQDSLERRSKRRSTEKERERERERVRFARDKNWISLTRINWESRSRGETNACDFQCRMFFLVSISCYWIS